MDRTKLEEAKAKMEQASNLAEEAGRLFKQAYDGTEFEPYVYASVEGPSFEVGGEEIYSMLADKDGESDAGWYDFIAQAGWISSSDQCW